jgi:mono/diheme cytochrome c family protein
MILNVARRRRPVWLWLAAVGFLGTGAWHEAVTAVAAQTAPITLDAQRAALMRKHFGRALAIKDGVIRGDLAVVTSEAAALMREDPPQGLPTVAAPFVTTLKREAQRAAEAKDIVTAASASSSMLATCGNCHQTVGVRPAFAPLAAGTSETAPAGVVGHMIEHQRAADLMFEGLVLPSTTSWREGAARLNVVRLRDRELPRDSRWTPDIIRAEERLHRFAGDAVDMHDYAARAASYAQVIATCAECHGLHEKVWGPSGR